MNRAGRIRFGLVAAAATVLLAVGQVAGAQEDRDLGTITGKAEGAASEVAGDQAPGTTAPAQVPEEPTETDDSPGHTTEAPEEPSHASGTLVQLDVAGEDAVTVGRTNAQVNDDGSSQGDVVVLALGGSNVIATESHSDGPQEGALGPAILCEESDGAICVGLLFAETESTESGTTSSSQSHLAVAFICLGGTQTSPADGCDGTLGAGAGESNSSASRDKSTGATEAEQETSLANVTIGGDIQLALLTSESSSQASGQDEPGTTQRASCVVELGGECVADPTAVSLPPDCPADPGSLVCLFLNQGSSWVFTGGAGSAQEPLHLEVLRSDSLPGGFLLRIHVARSESLAIAAEPEVSPRPPTPTPTDVIPRRDVPTLPVTGAHALPLLALALILGTGGSGLLALDRRREDLR